MKVFAACQGLKLETGGIRLKGNLFMLARPALQREPRGLRALAGQTDWQMWARILLLTVLGLCMPAPGNAINFKIDGLWYIQWTCAVGATFGTNDKPPDKFHDIYRIGLKAEASEDVFGYVQIQASGDWGLHKELNITPIILQGYIDWAIPETKARVRIGRQYIALPALANGKNPGFWSSDATDSLVVSLSPADWLSLTGFWGRPDSPSGGIDMFALTGELKLDPDTIRPFAAYTRYADGVTARRVNDNEISQKGPANVFTAGLSVEVKRFSPWTLKYGVMFADKSFMGRHNNQRGGISDISLRYKTDFGSPELFAFYGSGDPADAEYPYQGSMPAHVGRFMGSYGFYGGSYLDVNGLTDNKTGSGAWGVRLGLRDIPSFMEGLTHNVAMLYARGNHDVSNASKPIGATPWRYMTTRDSIVELDFSTRWKVCDEFSIYLESAYVHPDFITRDEGRFYRRADSYTDAWKVCGYFFYYF